MSQTFRDSWVLEEDGENVLPKMVCVCVGGVGGKVSSNAPPCLIPSLTSWPRLSCSERLEFPFPKKKGIVAQSASVACPGSQG